MFIVFEIQTNADGSIGTLVTTYTDRNQAESAYHQVLAAAAVSTLPKHSCSILNEEGEEICHVCYTHQAVSA